jgi:hypothetical protein
MVLAAMEVYDIGVGAIETSIMSGQSSFAMMISPHLLCQPCICEGLRSLSFLFMQVGMAISSFWFHKKIKGEFEKRKKGRVLYENGEKG